MLRYPPFECDRCGKSLNMPGVASLSGDVVELACPECLNGRPPLKVVK